MAFSVLVPFLVGVVLAESECATQGACEDSAFLQRNAKDVAKDAPKFDKAQLIGFSIYTFPVNTGLDKDAAMEAWNEAKPFIPMLAELGIHVNVTYESVQYYAGLDDPEQDVKLRFNLMKFVCETARKKADYDPADSTLKVFMAPEFFFRGERGAYDANSVYGCDGDGPKCQGTIHTLLTLMKDFVADEKWKGWLFVFGTVIADEPKPDDPTKSLYYNAAPVLLGGSSERFLVTKQFISSIDFLSACAPSQQCTEKPKAEANAVIPEYAQKYLRDLGFQVIEDNIFTVGGVLTKPGGVFGSS
ncbi:unnamed protein product [Symbiodinium natans]|uniref:Uncharacterized protein n=1 Tax=Symbiodinium natans TaxID=878477 RepID=A0A812QYM1_9DINO|nr:unnamed protein product [Symbiodinium natans]